MRPGDAVPSVRPRRPRSLRARTTLAATVVIGSLLLAAVLVTGVAVHALGTRHFVEQAATAARQTAVAAGAGRLPDPIPATEGVMLIQVVSDDTGQVVAASAPLRGKPPITTLRPGPKDTRVDGRVCPDGDLVPDCMAVTGYDIQTPSYGGVMVYAAVAWPWTLSNGLLEAVLGGLCAVVLGLLAWGMWRAVGRALRPVARIEGELAEINATALDRRVPVPDTGDEIERLALTLNRTLDRLERSADQQRQFVADASHELRTPLTGLRTRVEFALADPDDTDLPETLREVLGDAERLQRIVENLLELARLDTGTESAREPLDLGELAAAELAAREPRVPVKADLSEGVTVVANRLQLARVLANLLANADRYAESSVEVTVRAEGGDAVLEVRDDGPGIPPADRERVFERFTRLDTARSRGAGGSGLGLSIARETADRHGGRLEAADVPEDEQGARLVLRLPLAPKK
ncbi:sensor histidine kinase [Actinomadura hibisca]|uniref:sensor histidine kinase n=1 Tax=Actinomadura hibisca TaxID=68565 RepID=UPI0008313D5F|nr:HAMP domain-containing sensor histidine kinase [Actinomadura hibisca]